MVRKLLAKRKRRVDKLTDIIWGVVKTILGPSSFELSVTHRKDDNKNDYSDIEKVRFSETDIVTILQDPNQRTKELTEQNLRDLFVKCEIENRDGEGFLIGKVSHSGQGGY